MGWWGEVCYIFVRCHPINIIWNVVKISGQRYVLHCQDVEDDCLNVLIIFSMGIKACFMVSCFGYLYLTWGLIPSCWAPFNDINDLNPWCWHCGQIIWPELYRPTSDEYEKPLPSSHSWRGSLTWIAPYLHTCAYHAIIQIWHSRKINWIRIWDNYD